MRIGLIGTASSHAEDFLGVLNERERHPGFRIVGLSGGDAVRSENLARRFGVARVAADPKELIGAVDAVIVGDRHGARHARHALPFLAAGLPVFIDKPLACSLADAEAILAAAERSGAPVASASAVRWQPDTDDLAARTQALGGPLAVVTSGPFDPESEHGGVFFYGIHAVELALQLAGGAIADVVVDRTEPDSAVLSWQAGQVRVVVCLSRPEAGSDTSFRAEVACRGAVLPQPIRLGPDYMTPVIDRFVDMLKTRRAPLSRAELLAPVRVLSALDEALRSDPRSGRELLSRV